ncbi:MAG TPA: hypothetical protein VFN52_03325 [Acidiferrobacteraceae bacterium]|nr:hypothetical protein [Acidiferrobacteraceae bacterium]
MNQTLRGACVALSLFSLAPVMAMAAPGTNGMSRNGSGMGAMGSMGGKKSGGGMCPMMGKMGGMGAMGNTVTLPVLPPGNEALQLRMNGAILRAVGEIEQKYASKVRSR